MRKTYQERTIERELMADDLDDALYAIGTVQAIAYLNTLSYLKSRPAGMRKPDWAAAKGKIRSKARDYIALCEAKNA